MVESIVFMSLLFVLCLLGLPIVAIVVLISRATSSTSKERMEMIKRGMIPPEKVEHKPNRLKSLRTGLGAIGLGVGAIASIFVLEYMLITSNPMYILLIVLGTIFICYGIAYAIYYLISKNQLDAEDEQDSELKDKL